MPRRRTAATLLILADFFFFLCVNVIKKSCQNRFFFFRSLKKRKRKKKNLYWFLVCPIRCFQAFQLKTVLKLEECFTVPLAGGVILWKRRKENFRLCSFSQLYCLYSHMCINTNYWLENHRNYINWGLLVVMISQSTLQQALPLRWQMQHNRAILHHTVMWEN